MRNLITTYLRVHSAVMNMMHAPLPHRAVLHTTCMYTTYAQWEILAMFGSLQNPDFIQMLACPKKLLF